jgi:ABC-type oligopeptide transport system substrate-binding subunit
MAPEWLHYKNLVHIVLKIYRRNLYEKKSSTSDLISTGVQYAFHRMRRRGAGKTDILTVCVGPDPDTIDPALNSAVDGATLIVHGFEGLMTLDKNGVPVPGQAKDYDVSSDGTEYTFHLRDGLKWSDGKPLKASDFVYSWNRAIAPDTAADYAYMFEVIDGYENGTLNISAPDDKTFVVKLVNAVPYFLNSAHSRPIHLYARISSRQTAKPGQ